MKREKPFSMKSEESNLTEDQRVLVAYKQHFVDSYLKFIVKAWEFLNQGEVLIMNWHIIYVINELEYYVRRVANGEPREHHLIINIPPRSLKSYLVTMCLAAWAWLINPTLKLVGSSHSSNLAIKHNVKTRRLVESDWYRMFSEVELMKDQNQKGLFENTQGGFREATSVGSSYTGSGGNIIVLDDPQNPKEAGNDKARIGTIKYLDETLSTRLNRPDIDMYIIVMQRLHEEDLTGHVLTSNPTAWRQISLPAEVGKGLEPKELESKYIDGLLFPDRFNRRFLDAQKIAMGSYGYAGQYAQLPAPEEGGIIKKDWFTYIEKAPNGIAWDLWIDGAYTENKDNDPTGLMMVGDDLVNGRIIIRHFQSEWLGLPELLAKVPHYMGSHGGNIATMTFVEPKASGIDIVNMLKKRMNIKQIKGSLVQQGKKARAHYASPFIESSRVVLVRGNWNDAYIHQMCSFPNAAHDEAIDLTGYATKHYLRNE